MIQLSRVEAIATAKGDFLTCESITYATIYKHSVYDRNAIRSFVMKRLPNVPGTARISESYGCAERTLGQSQAGNITSYAVVKPVNMIAVATGGS